MACHNANSRRPIHYVTPAHHHLIHTPALRAFSGPHSSFQAAQRCLTSLRLNVSSLSDACEVHHRGGVPTASCVHAALRYWSEVCLLSDVCPHRYHSARFVSAGRRSSRRFIVTHAADRLASTGGSTTGFFSGVCLDVSVPALLIPYGFSQLRRHHTGLPIPAVSPYHLPVFIALGTFFTA